MNNRLALFKYPGGKARYTEQISRVLPRGGNPYVEPFCGAASLLFSREPAEVEVLNDLDGNLVNFFRVIQRPDSLKKLMRRLRFTLHSRMEFELALKILTERASGRTTGATANLTSKGRGRFL